MANTKLFKALKKGLEDAIAHDQGKLNLHSEFITTSKLTTKTNYELNNMLFPSAKIIVKHPYNPSQFLVVKRKGYYEPAGGKVEVNFAHKTGETLEACAIREAFEELGLSVKIDQYLGSYYFFWSIDPTKASVCAVFLGSITNYDNNVFASNKDKNELLIEPTWATLDEIKKNINPEHIGLKEVFDLLATYLAR